MKASMKETKKMARMILDGDEKKLCCVTADDELIAKIDITKISLDQAFELYGMKEAIDFQVKENAEKVR